MSDTNRILETLERMDARLARMDTRLERIDTGQGRLEAEQAKLRADLMLRTERLQDDVTAIRDDIASNYGAADHATKLNEHTRDEVRSLTTTVYKMQQQILRLRTDVVELRDAKG